MNEWNTQRGPLTQISLIINLPQQSDIRDGDCSVANCARVQLLIQGWIFQMCIRCFQLNCMTPTWGNETGSLCVAVLQLHSYQWHTITCHDGKGLALHCSPGNSQQAGTDCGGNKSPFHFTELLRLITWTCYKSLFFAVPGLSVSSFLAPFWLQAATEEMRRM